MVFGTSGIRGRFGQEVTADLAMDIGRALADMGISTAVIGQDPRTTSPLLADAVTIGLREHGVDVHSLGEVATPTLARSVGWYGGDVGVMITASHNPPTDNGIKLWNAAGMAFDESQRNQITRWLEGSEQQAASPTWTDIGTVQEHGDATRRHVKALVEVGQAAEGDLSELSVIVDVGNGMGQATVQALRELGCSVEALNEQPDGRFPSRSPEPTVESCSHLRQCVAGSDADIGIAHDGDADRMMAVDEHGAFLEGDQLLALFAADHVEPGDHVGVPINTSLAVDEVVGQQGGTVTRTRVGDVYIAELVNSPDYVFGGEPSGAWIWPEQTLCPDGPLAAIKLTALVARRGPLSTLVADLPTYPIRRASQEVKNKSAVMDRVRQSVEKYDEVNNSDGVRVTTDQGWFLIRASGTEPVIRLTAEGRSQSATDQLFDEANNLLAAAIQA